MIIANSVMNPWNHSLNSDQTNGAGFGEVFGCFCVLDRHIL